MTEVKEVDQKEEDEIKYKWIVEKNNKQYEKISNKKITTISGYSGEGQRAFLNYKFKEEDIRIKLKIKNSTNINMTIGFVSKEIYKNKQFSWKDDYVYEWYSSGDIRDQAKSTNEPFSRFHDTVEFKIIPSEKKIEFKNEKLKKVYQKVMFPIYMCVTVWSPIGIVIDVKKFEIID